MSTEWAALAEREGNLFATPEWLSLWWRHEGNSGEPPVEEVRSASGELVALLPVYLWRERPLRVARFLGHGAGDELGPLCLAGAEEEAASALREWLARRRVAVLLAEQLNAERLWGERLEARSLSREGNARIVFDGGDWDAYLATRSRNFRSLVRRALRNAEGEHGLAFRLADDPARLDADLDSLFRLHRLRWAGTTTDFAAREAFHRAFAHVAFERGWLRLWLLETDGKAVGAWHGFRFGEADLYYQAGRDPEWEHASVGLALLAHSVRDAQEAGRREYRFGRGGEEFKYRFTDDDPGLETVALTRGALGAAAVAAVVGARRVSASRRRPL